MKKRLVLFIVSFLFVCSSYAQDTGLLIDDFEGAITGGADGTADFGSGNGSSVVVTASPEMAKSGAQSLKVVYNAVAGGYMWIARGFGLDAANSAWLAQPKDIDWQQYNAFSFQMYGSDTKAQIAVDIKDNGGEMWRFIVNDNFTGWQEIICPLDQFFARSDWQPQDADKNDTLDFPVKSYQFEVLPEAKGTLYFDEVKLIKR